MRQDSLKKKLPDNPQEQEKLPNLFMICNGQSEAMAQSLASHLHFRNRDGQMRKKITQTCSTSKGQ
jgi:hypothetical protein